MDVERNEEREKSFKKLHELTNGKYTNEQLELVALWSYIKTQIKENYQSQ